ncbi:hypothetical protein GCM10022410_18900 [Amphibacillus indicireducens]|uniref:Transposase n=1 Tax=Amphibacillus indicireducens TaxID=1076330 RepID=A0ABP7VT39_9BACI
MPIGNETIAPIIEKIKKQQIVQLKTSFKNSAKFVCFCLKGVFAIKILLSLMINRLYDREE